MQHERVPADVLGNAVWHSIDGPRGALAERAGLAGRFQRDVAPFAGVADSSPDAWDDLAGLVGPGGHAILFVPATEPPRGWTVVPELRVPCVQMLAGAQTPQSAGEPFGDLGAADVPEMLDLVRATRPGPFFARTIEFGGYIGRRVDGRLIAMGGERLRCPGYTEVSAICTSADHRGRGLATAIVLELVARIRARGEEAFLHVAQDNTTALRLYLELGFSVTREVDALTVRNDS